MLSGLSDTCLLFLALHRLLSRIHGIHLNIHLYRR